jgi:HD-GYP domain-containing protein (c-di-GMP phosphodiesterase class II)
MPFINTKKTSKSVAISGISDLMSEIIKWSNLSDEYEQSQGHARRVADICLQIGNRYGLSKDELDALECAALLHDVGQIDNYNFIKEERELDASEKIALEEHSLISEKMIEQIANIGNAKYWARWHHERWDGLGYPDKLSEEMIPLPARILALADTYDSLTHDRPYRSAMSSEEAIAEIQKMAGIMFDPNVVQVFLSIDSNSDIGNTLEV